MSDLAFHAAARSWIGVPFRHQGRDRGGVDCAGLAICVARELGWVPVGFDVNGYRRAPDGSMLAVVRELCAPAPLEQAHFVIMAFSREPQHVALLVPYRHGGLAVVHALESSGKVVEHRLDRVWRERVVGSYRMPEAAHV